MTPSSPSELFDACAVLFGPDIDVSLEFLRYLRPAGIKDAYWRRALETHPDRAGILGESQAVLTERFQAVTAAYARLMAAVKGDGTLHVGQEAAPAHPPGPAPGQGPVAPRRFEDRYFRGPLPRWPLRIGQYLYYSGRISYGALIEAITLQRRQRPLIGKIALDWGLLTPRDLGQILTQRGLHEKFGDCALRRGYLTPFNLKTLLFRQQTLQQPIGTYWRKYGFSESLMQHLVAEQRRHNRSAARS